MSSMCQCGCAAQNNEFAKVDEILAKYKGMKGALIPVLQETQEAYGYLPEKVLARIAEGMDVPLSQIYGVVTFYAQFHLEPRGKYVIRVCQGTACHVRGGKKILEKLEEVLGVKPGGTTKDLKFTLETVACLGACGLAPVMMVNDDTHGRLTTESVVEVLKQYE